ncbi:MAG: alpha/beta fold hydrolase [Ruminococcus sp.]|nr:alpha/beta fold hydrolase [Ruminococcus sp.]
MLNADTREFEFTSDFDGLVVSAVIAAPSGNVNGVVQIVHGMNEYKERYFPFMDYLAEEGFITVIHDNRGHGKSICSPDDLGFMYRAGGKGFVSDIAQLNGIIKKRFPELPLFLIGHSMGSLGARCFLKDHDDQIGGLVVLGCPCYSRFSGFARSIESALSKGLGSRFRSEKIDEAAEKMLGKGFENVPHSWICSDPEVVEKFNADPMCNFKYTLNGYEGLLWLMKETYSKKGWQVKNPRLPIRFVSGKDDPCMLSEKKFFKAMDTLEKVGYESISHRFFDGMRHEVLNEKNSMNVYKDIAKTLFSWIDRIHEQEAQAMMSAPQQEAQPAHEPIAMPEDVFEALEETTEQVPVPTSAKSVMEEKKQAAADAQAQVMQLLESVSPTSSDEN